MNIDGTGLLQVAGILVGERNVSAQVRIRRAAVLLHCHRCHPWVCSSYFVLIRGFPQEIDPNIKDVVFAGSETKVPCRIAICGMNGEDIGMLLPSSALKDHDV